MYHQVWFIFTLIIACGGDVVPDDTNVICENAPRGFYCSANLGGVRECHRVDGQVTSDSSCGFNQQCGCGILRMCSEDEPRCIKRVPLQPVPKDFATKFTGQQNISSPGGLQKIGIFGLAWMDGKNRRKRVRTKRRREDGDVTTVDEYTVPDENGNGWKKYTHTILSSGQQFCVSVLHPTFSTYFEDLRSYSVQAPDAKDANERLYREGPLFPNGKFTEKTWQLARCGRKCRHSRFFFPKTESSVQSGGPNAKLTVKTNLRYFPYHFGSIPDFRFAIPEVCLGN